jgi:pentatricopeptide repeat protein
MIEKPAETRPASAAAAIAETVRPSPAPIRPLRGPPVSADARGQRPEVRPGASPAGRRGSILAKNGQAAAPARSEADDGRARAAQGLLESRIALFRRDPGYRDDLLKLATSLIGSRCTWEAALGFVDTLQHAGIAPNVQVCGALIARAERERQPERVLQVFHQMQQRGISLNPIVCTPVMTALGRLGRSNEAEQLLRTMESQGQPGDIKAFGALMSAHARRSDADAVDAVERLHGELLARGLVPDDRITGARLQVHARAGRFDQAFAFFDALLNTGVAPHIGVCNTLIAACEVRGASARALGVFGSMVERQTRPNSMTFAALMRTCVSAGSPNVTLSAVEASIACGLLQPAAGYDADANCLGLWAHQVLAEETQWRQPAPGLSSIGTALAQFHLSKRHLTTHTLIEGPESACRSAAQAVQAHTSSMRLLVHP